MARGFVRPSAAIVKTIQPQATHVDEPQASQAFQSRPLEIEGSVNIEVLQNASDLGEEIEQHVEDLASAAIVFVSEDSIESNR